MAGSWRWVVMPAFFPVAEVRRQSFSVVRRLSGGEHPVQQLPQTRPHRLLMTNHAGIAVRDTAIAVLSRTASGLLLKNFDEVASWRPPTSDAVSFGAEPRQ
ncbi:hypothetical protein GCM10027073_26140 [Streptomyces chlorus]